MKKVLLTALLAASLLDAAAGDRFVPVTLPPADAFIWAGLNTQTQNYTRAKYLYELFEFPDEVAEAFVRDHGSLRMAGVENLKPYGVEVTVTTDASRDDFFKTAELRPSTMSGDQVVIQAVCKSAYSAPGQPGTGTVHFNVTYRGETVTNDITFEFSYYKAVDETVDADNETVTKIDFSYNDRATNSTDKTVKSNLPPYTVEIVGEPVYGDVSWEVIRYRNPLGNMTTAQHLVYTPRPGTPNYSYETLRIRKTIPKENDTRNLTEDFVVEKTLTLSLHKNPYATRIIDFLPAPGQFVNSSESFNYAGASKLLGVDAEGNAVTPDPAAMVSLGGFGGYIIFGFDQPVTNDPRHPYGVDFTILGNSFEPWEKGWWCEPAAVQVMQDTNGNGIPDDGEWYELAGSDYWLSTTRRNITMTYHNPHYDSRYTVPWTTDDGQAGALLTNAYHNQPYWPLPSCYPGGTDADRLSYTGTMIMCSPDKRCPSYIEFDRAPAFGYADNRGVYTSDLTKPLNPYRDDEHGKASDGFDLSWAVDKDGNYVELDHVDFIKVYTNGSFNAGWLGEWSAEVCRIALTTPVEGYEPQDWYINYIGLNRLQVIKGESYRYEGFVFRNGRPVTEGTPRWWVDDTDIGTIDNEGNFTALNVGKTRIHFRAYDDAPEDVVTVEVVELKGLLIDLEGHASTVSNDRLTCVRGEIVYINVESLTTCEDVRNGTMENRYIYDTYTWDNSDPTVGTVTNGLFTALRPGTTTLTVHSDHDPSFTDAIEITVIDPVAPELISDRIKVPSKAPKGGVPLKRLLANSRDASMTIRGLRVLTSGAPVTCTADSIFYDYTGMSYREDRITFTAACYGIDYSFEIPVIFGPDQAATPAQILFAGTALTANPVETAPADGATAPATVTYVGELPATAAALHVQGAYAWIATDSELLRYCVADGSVYSRAPLTPGNDHSQLAIVEDKIYVADGDIIRTFYKTDLTVAADPIAVGATVTTMAAYDSGSTYTPSCLYILTGTTGRTLRCCNLKTRAMTDKTLYLGNCRPRLLPVSDSQVIVAYDANTATRYNMGNSTAETTPASTAKTSPLAVYAGNKLIMADGADICGYTWQSASGTFMRDAAPLATLDGTVTDIVYSAQKVGYSTKHYILALTADGYTAYEYASSKLTALPWLVGAPADAAGLRCYMNAVDENDAPIAVSPAPTVVYERTRGSYTSITPAITDFNDESAYSKSYTLYPRNLDEFGWLQNPGYSATSVWFTPFYDEAVDEPETRNLRFEVIDNAGASTFYDIPIRLTPWLYKPHIRENGLVILTGDGDVNTTMDFGDVYMLADNPHLTLMSYGLGDDAANVPSDDSPWYEVDADNNQLLRIHAPQGYAGTMDMHLRQISTFVYDNEEVAQYNFTETSIPDKEFEATVPVRFVATSGITDARADTGSITYDPQLRAVRLTADTRLRMYTPAGVLVLDSAPDTDRRVDVSQLVPGLYIAHAGEATAKIVIR